LLRAAILGAFLYEASLILAMIVRAIHESPLQLRRTQAMRKMLGVMAMAGLAFWAIPSACWSASEKGAAGAHPAWVKQVSEGANFVFYIPQGWKAQEGVQGNFRTLYISDPGGAVGAGMFYGVSPTGDDPVTLAKVFAGGIGRNFPDLQIRQSLLSKSKDRIVFDGEFSLPQGGKRGFQYWISAQRGNFVCSVAEAPAGKLSSAKPLLLTILANVHLTKGGFREGPAAGIQLVPHQLRDGSASFKIPSDWQFQDFGTGAFAAKDPGGFFGFMVASVNVLDPRMGVQPPGTFVSPYLPPHQAMKMLVAKTGAASDIQFLEVRPRPEMNQQMAQVYTAGPVATEEFLYTYASRGRGCKGYTFGVSFGSRLGTNWRFWHVTVGAPRENFDSFGPHFAEMVQSYQIDDAFAMNYIARGMERLRQMQRQTAEIVSRNAQEIRQMMQAAYDERSKSMDYIDYQRSQYIRGEQDWISHMEGGTIYKSDRWGTKNTATGETWEGQPYNTYNFKGENPKYHESMTPIDNRALYEKYRK
jgi:hypothetical protein